VHDFTFMPSLPDPFCPLSLFAKLAFDGTAQGIGNSVLGWGQNICRQPLCLQKPDGKRTNIPSIWCQQLGC
jgi:hypothetical protein